MLRSAQFLFVLMLCACRPLFSVQAYALRVSITANGPWVTVGQVLSPEPGPEIANLTLKRLESPGRNFNISRDLVELKIRGSVKNADVTISGNTCEVTASHRWVKGEDIRKFGEKYVRDRLASLSATAVVQIESREAPKDLMVPDRTVRLEIPPATEARWRGNVVLRIVVHETGEDGMDLEVGQALMTYFVRVQQTLLVASKAIRNSDAIDATDAGISSVDATFLQEDGYADLSQVAGLKSKVFIGPDKVILPSMLERPPVIKRGDIVKLVVQSGMVTVETSAEALRDAALGDSIPVQIVSSRKELQARVLNAGTVMAQTQ
jgi:flagellar basal body P-ring formation protein FlgA